VTRSGQAHIPPELTGLDRFIRKGMREWNVPGAAVGIVKGNRVVYARGFGVTDLTSGEPVTEHTRFPINSMTKAFTATVLGQLVDDGRLAWDRPLRDYLPLFRMHDPVATERTTTRDILLHRTGLAPHHVAMFSSLATRAPLLERLPHLQPSLDFRSGLCYTNAGVAVTRDLVERLTGRSWEHVVSSRIFKPLGMGESQFATEDLSMPEDIPVGYVREGGRLVPWLKGKSFPLAEAYRPKAPACAVVASLSDMCRWLRFQMNGGRVRSQQIIGESTLAEIHLSQMATSKLVRLKGLFDTSFALGWRVQPYRGHRRLWHGGSGRGYSGTISFLQEESSGVVILTNSGVSPLVHVVQFNVFDRLLGLSRLRWNEEFRKIARRRAARAQRNASGRSRPTDAPPPRPLAAYEGCYAHPGYGRLTVSSCGEGLTMSYSGLRLSMRYAQGDMFDISGRHEEPITGQASFRGNVSAVAVPFEPSAEDIVFTRVNKAGR